MEEYSTLRPRRPITPSEMRKQKDLEKQANRDYWYSVWWILALAFAIFLGIWGVVLGYVVNDKAENAGGSELTTDFFSPPLSLSSSEVSAIATADNTLMIPCLDFSIGNETKSFSGTTFIGQVCPTPLNPCLMNTCVDGLCQEALVVEDGCYHDSMCTNSTNGTKCDLDTCMCISEPPAPPGCSINDDCMLISNSMCESVTCVDGRCVRNNTNPTGCGNTQECAEGEVCDSTCTCVTISSGITAVVYTPSFFNFTNPALNLTSLESLTANYVDFGNYVRIRIQYSAFASGTTDDDFSFDFSLPSGLLANTTGTAVGNHIVHTTPGLIVSASNTTLSAHGTVATADSSSATATGANVNPMFTGPSEASDLYTGVVFFEYFKSS